MLCDFRVKQFGAMLLQGSQRSGLVDAHEAAVSDYVGGQNRSETAFHVFAAPQARLKQHPITSRVFPGGQECLQWVDFVEEVGVAAAHTQGERDQPGLIRFMLAAVPASG
jgi:hypothetical protein